LAHFIRLLGAMFLVTLLVACDTAEERAEGHYQNALSLAEDGDIDRAIVELRNVFELDGTHLEARQLIAELLYESGDIPSSYGQYLRLVEQSPDNLDARLALAEMAFQSTNWDELERHGAHAEGLAPDDPRVQIISTVRDYRKAVIDEDQDAMRAAVDASIASTEEFPENVLLRELNADYFIRTNQFTQARGELEKLTAEYPQNKRYWGQRLQILLQLGDEEGAEAQLVEMVDRFPDDIEQKTTLVRYYLSRDDDESAEAFLRKLVTEADPENNAPRLDLVRFLLDRRGTQAGIAELEDAIENEANALPFVIIKAGIDFATDDQEGAIASLEAILETAEPGEDTNSVKVTLARMLLASGNEVGARSLVETVLTEEPGNVEAAKMNARWLIDADDPDGAISLLREALDKNADDPQALTLMAEANSRKGSTNLARDFLALAVEASGNAPGETMRYARQLISEERYLPAEDLLLDALRLAPNNIDLLEMTGDLYLLMEDFGRVSQVVQTLQRIEDPRAQEKATSLELRRLEQQSGTDEAIAFLETLAGQEDASFGAQVALIRARLSTQDFEEALALAETLSAENPDNPTSKLVLAATASTAGDLDRAAELYRTIVDELPLETGVWLELSRIKFRQGDREGSIAVIDEALALNPEDGRLLWAQASYLEQQGDYEGAIAIYDQLYADDTGNILVANNLASMLTTYRDDPESIERAWNIARRFRDNPSPAVKDTYGWIAHRRGDSAEAVDYLRDAAAGLPDDAVVQFHFAEALFALDRKEQALEQYRKVIEIAGVTDTRPQIDRARAQLTAIEEALAAE
jgi:tetratricopeptide (TPR) repeat protein